jgi:hypothetical protein
MAFIAGLPTDAIGRRAAQAREPRRSVQYIACSYRRRVQRAINGFV